MKHPPSEATSQQTFLEDLDRQRAAARKAGGYTAVLKLAQGHEARLRHELSDVTRGLTLKWVSSAEQTEPSPVEIRINRLRWELRQWDAVAGDVAEHAANEAHGWEILDDGTPAKVLANGKVLGVRGGIRYEEEDGTIVDTSQRGDQWERRNRVLARQFGERVRAERIERARTRRSAKPLMISTRRPRERRPRTARRAASSSTTSGSDPGDPDEDSESSRGDLRHISGPLAAELDRIAGRLRAKGGVG